MILVVGALGAGKTEYAKSLGYSDAEMADAVLDARPVVTSAQNLVRDEGQNLEDQARQLAQKQVVCIQEVGGGIVPLDAGERAWRERAGQLSRLLAQQAQSVVQVCCGLPQCLKGELPQPRRLQVVIMRHGSTTASERRAYAGWLDVPLTPNGMREAHEAGTCPQVDLVHTSTLQRSRNTARICFPNAVQVPHDDLREMCFGDFQGRTADEMVDDAAYREWVDGNCEGICPHGEGQAQFEERIAREVERIVRDGANEGRTRVVIAAHGGTIMAAMTRFAKTRRDYYDWLVDPCQGYYATAVLTSDGMALQDEVRFSSLDFMDEAPLPASGPRPASSSFFQNRACRYFPCHDGVDRNDFNCLLCYCPLYTLGPKCGGNFRYTDSGRKDCTNCTVPHQGDAGVKLVASRYGELAELARYSDE